MWWKKTKVINMCDQHAEALKMNANYDREWERKLIDAYAQNEEFDCHKEKLEKHKEKFGHFKVGDAITYFGFQGYIKYIGMGDYVPSATWTTYRCKEPIICITYRNAKDSIVTVDLSDGELYQIKIKSL